MTSRARLLLVVCGAALALAAVVAVVGPGGPGNDAVTTRADYSQFNPGNIIDDTAFFNTATMDAGDIATFLDQRGSACSQGADGSPCLRRYVQDTWTRPADGSCPRDYAGAPGESAAWIVFKVAQACGINPEVLLVVLQKEQGLITTTNPSATRYNKAMGYACPDTAPCDAQYYGFYNQVYMAARQFQRYRQGLVGSYKAGRTNTIAYYPNNPGCGSASVYIENKATAGLYDYTPYVPNAAALSTRPDGCSSFGNRNFWAYMTDWFGGPQAVVDEYSALKASGLDLGSPVAATRCDLPKGGCWQSYQGGTAVIYWSPATGAHLVRGAILTYYLAVGGGPGRFGYPIGDDSATSGVPGAYTHFQGGSIYWSQGTGAHVVRGALRDRWFSLGGPAGSLGFPVGDDTAVAGGGLSVFQGGGLFWSSGTGARLVRGALLDRYTASGGPAALGWPVADDGPAADGAGARVDLTGGSIYWSQATGAHVVRGALRDRWWQLGGETGALGYPTGDDTSVAGGAWTAFQGGSLFWSSGTGARLVRGALLDRYTAFGGPAAVGWPVADDGPAGDGAGARVDLTGGSIYWSQATGAHVVRGALRDRWWQLGGVTGSLGYPTGDDTGVAGGALTAFQNGSLFWSSGTGARLVPRGVLLDRYSAFGGPAALGFPVADAGAAAGGAGTAVDLTGGSIYWSQGTGAHIVRGALRDRWWQLGGVTGPLGYPTGDDTGVAGGALTAFQGGSLFWSPGAGARLVRGALLDRYTTFGGPAVLGFPVADDHAAADGTGARVDLTGGSIYWSRQTDAHVVRGALRDRWWQLGGETGPLGYPTSDDTAVTGGWTTSFTGGTLYWSADHGAVLARGALLAAYLAAGGPDVLGLPTADDGPTTAPTGGAWLQLSKGAAAYWSADTGAHVVLPPAAATYTGTTASELGFPTSDTHPTPDGQRTDFEDGYLLVDPVTNEVSRH